MIRSAFGWASAMAVCWALALPASAWERGQDLVGRTVETRDGEMLGQVRDFAVDLGSGRVHYVVVSVGSFLIEDGLIAVAPDALRDSADADGRLILDSDAEALRSIRRFGPGNWPDTAAVTAPSPVRDGDAGTGATAEATDGRGTATISDGSRTATLSAGERRIEITAPTAEPAAGRDTASAQAPASADTSDIATQAPPAGGPFARLDRDGNGVLDRAEIAHEMRRGDRYADIDSDASGAVEPDEFDALMQRRSPAGD